jgi:hypothetical protein
MVPLVSLDIKNQGVNIVKPCRRQLAAGAPLPTANAGARPKWIPVDDDNANVATALAR